MKDTPENVQEVALGERSLVKSDMEVILHRKCVILQLIVSVVTLVVLAINSDKAHNNKHPKLLPNISGITCVESQTATPKEKELGIITIDFSLVDTLQVLCSSDQKCVRGISFF